MQASCVFSKEVVESSLGSIRGILGLRRMLSLGNRHGESADDLRWKSGLPRVLIFDRRACGSPEMELSVMGLISLSLRKGVGSMPSCGAEDSMTAEGAAPCALRQS